VIDQFTKYLLRNPAPFPGPGPRPFGWLSRLAPTCQAISVLSPRDSRQLCPIPYYPFCRHHPSPLHSIFSFPSHRLADAITKRGIRVIVTINKQDEVAVLVLCTIGAVHLSISCCLTVSIIIGGHLGIDITIAFIGRKASRNGNCDEATLCPAGRCSSSELDEHQEQTEWYVWVL